MRSSPGRVPGKGRNPYLLSPENVLLEDPCILAVNKPAGIPTQPVLGSVGASLYEAVIRYLRGRPGTSPRSVGMPQRLDRCVSGVLLFSRHPTAHRPLTEAFKERRVEKTYLAIVEGTPASDGGTIDFPLARSLRRGRSSVDPAGLSALTTWRLVMHSGSYSLLEVSPLTGRTHQIRVHLAGIGCPVVGDRAYGAAFALPEGRVLLHAWSLSFPHPFPAGSHLTTTVQAPLPEDFFAFARTNVSELSSGLGRFS